ncbi:MAG: diguanylate cyclase [Pusillimonas sp.]
MQGIRRSLFRLARFLRNRLLVVPVAVFVGGMLLTYASWAAFDRLAQSEVKREFSLRADQTVDRFQRRLADYQDTLDALRALFVASDYVDHAEFIDFASTLGFHTRSPGTVALGFVELADGGQQAPVTYVYPENPRNVSLLGFNSFSDPERKRSMLEAAQTSRAVLSRPILLFQNDPGIVTGATAYEPLGYLLFLPVHADYKADGPGQVSALIGWVYIAFRLDEALATMFDGETVVFDSEIFDMTDPQDVRPVFRSSITPDARPFGFLPMVAERTASMLGRSWQLRILSTRQFQHEFKPPTGSWIVVLGLTVSAFLGFLSWLLLARIRGLRLIRRMNHQLRNSEQRWKYALEGAGDGVWDYDLLQGKIHVSARWKQMLGYDQTELPDSRDNWADMVHPEDYPVIEKTLADHIRGDLPDYAVEYRIRCKDGSWKWVLARGMVVERNTAGIALRMVGTATDISRMKASEELIWQQANFDALTGIPNRRMFFERLQMEIQRVQRYGGSFALLFIDLDEFKEINDQRGHHVGDAVLKCITRRLLGLVRSTDLVARLGGDEFTIILNQVVSAPDLESVVQKILAVVQQPVDIEGHLAKVSASIGVVMCPDDGRDADALLNKADRAMYAAKAKGKNQWQYYSGASV